MKTVISQLARTIHGTEGLGHLAYVLTIAGAFGVLFMAANTPFADFPQLAALHSGDGFLPPAANVSWAAAGLYVGCAHAGD